MARLVTVKFDSRSTVPTDGKIVVTMNNTDSPGDPFDFYIGITAPSGEEIKAFPTVTPDAQLDGGESDSFNIDIPLDSEGNYLSGTYVITVRRDGSTDTTVEKEYVYTPHNAPDHLSGSTTLTTAFSCLTGIIQAIDDTDYTTLGLTLDDREIQITPPSIDPQADVISATAAATMVVAYTNVAYQVQLSTSLTWDEEDLGDSVDAFSTGTILDYKSIDVTCETDGICESLDCLGNELTKAYNEACAAGGYSRLAGTTKDKIEWAMLNLAMAKFQYDCGNVTSSQTFLARAKEGINCGCGCSGATSDSTPQPFTPPAGNTTATISLQYWEETQDTTYSAFTPVKAGEDDFDAVITPKGDGAIRFRTGGTARGANALDLQTIADSDAFVAAGAQSIALGTNLKALNTEAIAIGTDNVANTDALRGIVIGKTSVVDEPDSVAIGTQSYAAEANSVVIGSLNTTNSADSVAIGNALTGAASHDGVFMRGNTAHAHQKNQDVFGIGSSVLQRSILTLHRSAVAGSSAFYLTAGGTNTNDLDFPSQNSGNWVYACRLTFAAVITATDGGFTVGDARMGTRQFIITKNGGTTVMQGAVEFLGDDATSASLTTLSVDIVADDTNDLLDIQVNPPGTMDANDELTVLATLEILEIGI